MFAGFGAGRANSKSLIGAWHGVEPRLGFAYAVNDKTTIRGSATRYYGPVEGINGSSHYLGFVVKSTAADTTNGIQPLWILSRTAIRSTTSRRSSIPASPTARAPFRTGTGTTGTRRLRSWVTRLISSGRLRTPLQ